MRKLIITIALLAGTSTIAQDKIYSTEGFSTFQHNPASFGNQEQWSVNVFGQAQWTKYSGVPGALSFNGGGRIPLVSSGQHELIIGGSYTYNQSYFVDDQVGRLALGYRFNLNENTSFSIALAPGVSDLQYSLFVPIYHPDAFGNDTSFNASNHDRNFDMSGGLMFNWKSLYAGVSATHLNRPQVGLSSAETPITVGFQAGYKIPLKDHSIFPMVQWHSSGGFSSAQFMTHYVFKNDLFSIGAGFRTSGDLLLGTSAQLKGFKLAYNYNLYGSKSADNHGGIHELRMSYSFKSK